MPYELTDDDRAEFLHAFKPPTKWSTARTDEVMRWWSVLVEEPGRVLLMHGTGAVAELTRRGDQITDVRTIEGEAARPLLRTHGFRPSDEQKTRVRRHVTAGKALDDALDEAFPRRLGVKELDGAPQGARRFRVGSAGVLEIDTDSSGAVGAHRWITGGEALDILEKVSAEARWDVPDFPQNPVPVRDAREADLYIAVQKGEPEERREREGKLEVLARVPEGRRRFVFDTGATGATSPCLDPADLVLFAARVREQLPAPDKTTARRRDRHRELLRLAAWGLREATHFVKAGDDLPPLGIYHTRAGEFLRMTQPDRFRTDGLRAEADDLEQLAATWGQG